MKKDSANKTKRLRQAPCPPVEKMLFRLRVRFIKQKRLAFLGHLEVIHTIERVIRRAGLPYAISHGFSPHMRVAYTSALPVGTSSTCEWFDVLLTELLPAEDVVRRLQATSAADLMPQEAAYVSLRKPALAAQITHLGYVVTLETTLPLSRISDAMEKISQLAQIPYVRSGKEKVLDLQKTLMGWELSPKDASTFELLLHTRCNNEGSLRPEIVLAALDRQLTGSTEPIVSTGIQNLESIPRYHVERVYQKIEIENGELKDPL